MEAAKQILNTYSSTEIFNTQNFLKPQNLQGRSTATSLITFLPTFLARILFKGTGMRDRSHVGQARSQFLGEIRCFLKGSYGLQARMSQPQKFLKNGLS
jgi:hypothetical protein